MNRTTKINILAYASEPDKNYKPTSFMRSFMEI